MTDAEENDVDLLFQPPDSFPPCFFIPAKISFDSFLFNVPVGKRIKDRPVFV